MTGARRPMAAPVTDGLFFAILPDPAAAGRIIQTAAALRVEHGLTGRAHRAERLHVTLHYLGAYPGLPEALVRSASQAGARAAASAQAFEVSFDHAASFDRRSTPPLVLRNTDGLAALGGLWRALGEALTEECLARLVQPKFTPHVTLMYADKAIADQPIDPISWRVDALVLFHSLMGEGRYEPIACWRFGA